MNDLTLKHENEQGAIYKRDTSKTYMRGFKSEAWVLVMNDGRKCSFKTLREAKALLNAWTKPQAISAKLCKAVPAF